ncbi:MAG: flagellar hook assembly protein FlgD [Candidatus Methylomirabilia bacterium]
MGILPILGAVLPPVINLVKSATTKKQSVLQKDDFLKLLVAQLRYQNPLSPTSSDQFISQSATFSSLEALKEIQKSVATVAAGASHLTGVSGLIGKKVTGLSATFDFAGQPVQLPYTLPNPAAQVVVEVTDSSGALVKRFNASKQAAGPQVITFDGLGTGSLPLPAGKYSYRVLATSALGGQPTPIAAIAGTVTGVTLQGGVPMVLLGTIKTAVSNLRSISN